MVRIVPERVKDEPASPAGGASPDEALESFFARNEAETQNQGDWITKESGEGQLAVDVSETDDAFVIETALAGVEPDDLNISIHRDMVTIKGRRHKTDEGERTYLYQECYWGDFSRSILLPVEVRADEATATLRRSILTIRLPKQEPSIPRTLAVEDQDSDEEAGTS